MNYQHFKIMAVAIACFSCSVSRLWAQDKTTKAATQSNSVPANTPSGESLLDAYADAIGANANAKKFCSRHSEGTMEMKEAGIKGKLSTIHQAPNRLWVRVEIPAIGEILHGTDGETAWEASVISGNRTLAGEERDEMIRRAMFDADAQWRDVYESIKTVGEEKVGDKDTWVVEAKPKKSVNTETNYYDKNSKLLVQSKMQMTSPMGVITIEQAFDDYRAVDGIKIPFTTTQKVLGQTQVIKLTKVTHNVEVSAGTFDKPK